MSAYLIKWNNIQQNGEQAGPASSFQFTADLKRNSKAVDIPVGRGNQT